MRALGTGLAPTLWRNCVWNSIYYGTVHRLEQAIDARDAAAAAAAAADAASSPPPPSPALRAARQLACGFAVGVFATCFNAPFDVVKSRFQAQLPVGMVVVAEAGAGAGAVAVEKKSRRRYERVFPTLAAIAREEGARALYRGFVPKALRLGIGQTVGLAAFQAVLDLAGVRERDAPEAAAEWRRVEGEAAAEVAAGG